MAVILTTALFAVTALALPINTVPVSLRDTPQALGVDPGELFPADLMFTTYAEKSCEGEGHAFKSAYGYYDAFQMQSYSLTRSLHDYEVLDFYTGFGTGLNSRYAVDHAMDGNYAQACVQYNSTAGINATTYDNKGHGRWDGCHELKNNEWCAVMWLKPSS